MENNHFSSLGMAENFPVNSTQRGTTILHAKLLREGKVVDSE